MPLKSPVATSVPIDDIEHGTRDHTTPGSSSSATPNPDGSKAVTPVSRRSLEFEDATHDRPSSRPQRIWTQFVAKLPAPVTRCSRKVVDWTKGPQPPRPYTITPLLERFQTLPVRLLGRLPPWARLCIYAVAFVLWAVLFAVILTNYSLPTNFAGFGAPVALSCVSNLWYVSHQARRIGQNS